MLTQAVESYLAVRRAAGFALKSEGRSLLSFAAFSDALGKHYVCSETAIEWAGSAQSLYQRARRLGNVIRFARYMRAEDQCHELPPAVFGREKGPRPVPYIFSQDDITRLVKQHPSWAVKMRFGGIPTERFSPCWPVPDFAYRRQSGSAFRISLQMRW